MTTDSTELTFVRCPSCRSLVPAISTRCRMCGASLDLGEQDDAKSVEETPQETAPQDMPGEDVAPALKETKETKEVPIDDILLDDLDEEFGDDLDDDDDELIDDPLSAFLEEVDSDGGSSKDVAGLDLGAQEPVKAKPQEEKPTVRIESGSHQPKKNGGLSFGGDKPAAKEAQPAPEKKESAPKGPQNGHRTDQPAPDQKKPQKDPKPEQKETREARSEPKAKKPEQNKKPEAKKKEPAHGATPAMSAPRVDSGFQKGRLCGWLVTYANPEGEAIELREGKFFVTQSRLKDHDMVLDDPSVSTPHALMSVRGNGELHIQDLMSDTGVHVRSTGDRDYRQEDENIVARHGDWIRFGDIEYLVTLIAHVGQK